MVLMRNRDAVNRVMMNFLDTHDTPRFITEIDGDRDKFLVALAMSIVYMGANSIYYGTELGLEGGKDPDCRRAFPWDNLVKKKELVDKIREILAIKNHPAIKNGKIKIYSKENILIIERFDDEKSLGLAINLGDEKDFEITSEILLANNYKNKILAKKAFLIWGK